jgi:hypothetical protein
MSELQNDSAESEIMDQPEAENQDIGVDLAPTSEAEHEEQPQAVDEEQQKQEAINKAINKKHFEAQQAKRELEAANARIQEFEEKQREQIAAQVGNIPAMPDAFDDDYDEKVKARDAAIAANAQFNAQQQAYQQQQQQVQQQAQLQEQQEFSNKVQAYNARATELGINQGELQAAANVVAELGLSDDLVKFIVSDSDGPLIVKHLAENQTEGFELAQMNPYLIGEKLNQIKANAAALKPKTSNAPAPSQQLSGNGVDKDAGKYQNIKGARFE